MNSYTVTSEMAGYHRKRGPVRVLFTAVFFAALAVLEQTIWPAKTKWGFLWSLGFLVIGGGLLGMLIELFHVQRHFPYDLTVSDDCVTEVHPTFQTSVRKDE